MLVSCLPCFSALKIKSKCSSESSVSAHYKNIGGLLCDIFPFVCIICHLPQLLHFLDLVDHSLHLPGFSLLFLLPCYPFRSDTSPQPPTHYLLFLSVCQRSRGFYVIQSAVGEFWTLDPLPSFRLPHTCPPSCITRQIYRS